MKERLFTGYIYKGLFHFHTCETHLISVALCQGKISILLNYIEVDGVPAFSKKNLTLQRI